MSENINPMDKFIDQYHTFSQHEAIGSLSDTNKVALFNKFVDAMLANTPSTPTPAQSHRARQNTGATDKQMNLIKRLYKDGHIEEPEWGNLTKRSASQLIDKGLQAEKAAREQKTAAASSQAPFGGSYSLF